MKVSVIIPVYNSEKYVIQCIDSILSQDFDDFELLLINDGSTDSSGEICDEYAEKDKRIKVFHKENGGPSSARNLGIIHAQGEWIAFVDSDDWVSEDYFELFKNPEIESDWILLNMKSFKDGVCKNKIEFDNFHLSRDEFLKAHSLHPHFFGPCGKFYSSKRIKENSLRFDESMNYGEDSVFNFEFLKSVQNVSSYNQSFYVYRQLEAGLSKAPYNYVKDYYFYKKCKQLLKDYPEEVYVKNMEIPIGRVLHAIFRDDELENRIELFTTFLKLEKDSFNHLYRNSGLIKQVAAISEKLGSDWLLYYYLRMRLK